MPILDSYSRPLRKLRISVTDRCNLRCAYCMPEESYRWLPKEEVLSFEELERLARLFRSLGVEEVRLTGGEPLLRRSLTDFVARLHALGFSDLAMTTNATLLPQHASSLRAAGLDRLTVSLDTLVEERFVKLTRRAGVAKTLEGIDAAIEAGFAPPKLNMVVMRGVNDDEILPMLRYAIRVGSELRFIEYMDVGGATQWTKSLVVSCAEILDRLRAEFGEVVELPGRGAAPAARWKVPGGATFGIIASTTRPFCGSCDRARLVADGKFFKCLYAREGLDLRAPLRSDASDVELLELLRGTWRGRDDRGAELRLGLRERGALASSHELAEDPHLEMHTRGG